MIITIANKNVENYVKDNIILYDPFSQTYTRFRLFVCFTNHNFSHFLR